MMMPKITSSRVIHSQTLVSVMVKSVRSVRRLLLSFALLIGAHEAAAKGQYLSAEEFLQQSFGAGSDPEMQALWLSDADKLQARQIFNRDYPGFRVRYWRYDGRTAWIFDEIGKTRPITLGIVIANKKIENISVLVFRESRGAEIRHPFFTQQFIGLMLQNDDLQLSASVDGITGATLSVRASIRVARFALYLNEQVANNEQAIADE